jgi:hypothetical protein
MFMALVAVAKVVKWLELTLQTQQPVVKVVLVAHTSVTL